MGRWEEGFWKEHIFPKKAWMDEGDATETRTDLEGVGKRKTIESIDRLKSFPWLLNFRHAG